MMHIFDILKDLRVINFFSKGKTENQDAAILPVARQIDSWQEANEKMA